MLSLLVGNIFLFLACPIFLEEFWQFSIFSFNLEITYLVSGDLGLNLLGFGIIFGFCVALIALGVFGYLLSTLLDYLTR